MVRPIGGGVDRAHYIQEFKERRRLTMDNKYLEKIAFAPGNMFKKVKNIAKNNPSAAKGAAIGAGIGGTLGGYSSTKTNADGKEVKRTKSERIGAGILLGVTGGMYGAQVGATRDLFKKTGTNDNFHKYYQQSRSSGGGARYQPHDPLKDLHKDLGFPTGGFKTKVDATKHYRKAAMKAHPDRGGSNEQMAKVNAAWDKYNKHPDGFNKLAMRMRPRG